MSSLFYNGDGVFVGIAYNGMGVVSSVAYSFDGTEWKERAIAPYSQTSAVNYGNGKFVLGIRKGIAYATDIADGDTWVDVSDSFFRNGTIDVIGDANITGIGFRNGLFAATLDNGNIIYSTDGIEWAAVNNSGFGSIQINGITYGNGKFIAFGNEGTIAYSN